MKVQRQYMEAKGVSYDSHGTAKDKKKFTLALDFIMPKEWYTNPHPEDVDSGDRYSKRY